ncbi:MAG: ABC transporter ATP-binding protein [Pseudomonadota bacterium]
MNQTVNKTDKQAAQQAASFRRSFQPWNDAVATPFIEFRGVTKRYGAFTAVDDLSLNIYEREFFALLGPSGCGKTTLMRMLAGFEEVTEGSVWLAGQNLDGVPPHKRPVNMMFQSYALFPHMSVSKNIAFGLKQEGMPKGEIDDRVAHMLALVKMQDFAKRRPDQLSGGQRQRVALARSLAKQPKLLLLDEPLGALDRKLREETQFELVDLQEKLGITFMIVTHDQEEAMTVADRVAVMEKGNIMQVAPPVEMYELPNSRYVADFLGNINLIEGRVASRKSGAIRLDVIPQEDGETQGKAIALTVESDSAAPVGSTVWFAARPEKFSIARKNPKGAQNCLAGEIWDIAYLGDLTIYKVKLDMGGFAKVSVLNHALNTDNEAALPMTWEERVYLTCDPESARLLEA